MPSSAISRCEREDAIFISISIGQRYGNVTSVLPEMIARQEIVRHGRIAGDDIFLAIEDGGILWRPMSAQWRMASSAVCASPSPARMHTAAPAGGLSCKPESMPEIGPDEMYPASMHHDADEVARQSKSAILISASIEWQLSMKMPADRRSS